MTFMVYSASSKTIKLGDNEEDFYCGDELTEVSISLARLKFGEITLTEAYQAITSYHNHKVIKGMGEQIEKQLQSMLERGIIEPRPINVECNLEIKR